MDLKQLLATVPERELVILSGVEDPNFQPVDEELIAKAQSEAKRINDILNGMQDDIEKKPYFESIEAALESSYGFLKNEYDVRDGDPAMEEMYFQRAKTWGADYTERCKTKSAAEIADCQTPLTEEELSGKKRCSGVRGLMRRASKECGQADFAGFLKNLGIDSVEQFIQFKNMYVASVVSKLVGGFIDTEQGVQEIRADKQASIVIGLPSAGKSTTISALKAQNHAFHIDADAIKAVTASTFGVSINAPGMHQLSSFIRDELVAEAKKQSVNLIIEKIGDEKEKIARVGQGLSDEGYTVGLSLVHVNNRKSRNGNAGRCLGACKKAQAQLDAGKGVSEIKPPRMVEDRSIISQGNGPVATYLELFMGRHDASSPFKGKFYACDNEVEFRGEELTASPITLYGISDVDVVMCSEIEKKRAEAGYKRIKSATTRTIAAVIYKQFKTKGAIPSELEQFLQDTANPPEADENSARKSSVQQTREKCKRLREDLENGKELSAADLSLLTTVSMIDASTRSILRTIYNPERASKIDDMRTDLENPEKNEYVIESVIKNLFSEDECQQYVTKVINEIKKKQKANKAKAARKAKAEAKSAGAETAEAEQPSNQ